MPDIKPDAPLAGAISELPPLEFTLAGQTYSIDTKRLSAADIRRVRAESGMSLLEWLQAAYSTRMLDLDGLAVFVWVARVQAGHKGRHGIPLTLADVDATIDYTDLEQFEMKVLDTEEAVPDPE